MKKIYTSRYFLLIFIPISLIFTLIYSWSISPLFLSDSLDSSIFKTIGLGMVQGKMPYVDLFDHKGGLLFMIEALGWIIAPGRWGLYILQSVFISMMLIFLFKTAELFIDRNKAFGATMASLLLYVIFMESGNQCETYILPATTVTLYLALKYFTNLVDRPYPAWYSFIYGVAFAFAFWIRPNDAISQIGSIVFGIFLFLMMSRQYLDVITHSLIFVAGFAISTAPIIIYFASHDCLMPLLDGTLLYNIKYATEGGMPSPMMILVPSFIYGILIWLSLKNKKKEYLYLFLPMLIFTLMLIGKRNYYHYLIIVVPSALVLFSFLLKQNWRNVLYILLIGIVFQSVKHHKYIIKSFQTRDDIEAFYVQARNVLSNVPENERTMVWSLNLLQASNDDKTNVFSTLDALLDSKITPCNRVFVYFHLNAFGEEEQIYINMPKWIVADPTGNKFQDYVIFLEENYDVIAATDGTCVGDITLFRRKNGAK